MKPSSVISLPSCSLTKMDWYHAVPIKHAGNPLCYAHTYASRTRFNAGHSNYPLLYFAPTAQIALLEVRVLVRSAGGAILVAPSAYVIYRVSIHLNCIVDFGDPASRGVVCSTAQELTGDWMTYPLRNPSGSQPEVRSHNPDAHTQDLGHALHKQQCIEGFLSPSAQAARYSNLIVFPDRVTVCNRCLCIRSNA